METNNGIITDELLPPVRSSFLTILCILTFISSGWTILTTAPMLSGKNVFMKMQTQKMDPRIREERRQKLLKSNDKESRFALKMMDSADAFMDRSKMVKKGILDIVSCLLTITGAIFMWRMNRNGFYLYAAGILLWILAPVIVYGSSTFIAVLEAGIKFFIGLLFTILYAFNLKDMKAASV